MAQIDQLKDLAQDTYDTLEAYRRAHEMAESPALKQTLERRISERTQTVNMLNSALEDYGKPTVDDTSASTQAADMLRAIASAFVDGDEAAAHRIEKAETDLCERYEDALKSDGLDTAMRLTIEKAAREVREGESFSHVLERQYG